MSAPIEDYGIIGNTYTAGDEWGCMGFWYSGRWYNRDAMTYLYQRSGLGEGVPR